MWLCQCDCGKKSKATENHLKAGARVSCGCRIHREKYNLPIEQLCAQDRLSQYRKGARQRGYEFKLDKKDFMDLLFKNCHYCGSEPYNTFTLKKGSRKQTEKRSVNYNGIDRVDNKKGYTIDNCVTCCKNCNVMKMQLDLEDFKLHISKIYNFYIREEMNERKEAGSLKRKK